MKMQIFFSRVIMIAVCATIFSCSKSDNSTTTGGTTGGTGGTGGNLVTVDINGMYFTPATISVKVGTTVKWTNSDYATHTVTSDNGSTFNSGNISSGSSFSYTTTTTGTFPYHCSLHNGMTGTLTVTN